MSVLQSLANSIKLEVISAPKKGQEDKSSDLVYDGPQLLSDSGYDKHLKHKYSKFMDFFDMLMGGHYAYLRALDILSSKEIDRLLGPQAEMSVDEIEEASWENLGKLTSHFMKSGTLKDEKASVQVASECGTIVTNLGFKFFDLEPDESRKRRLDAEKAMGLIFPGFEFPATWENTLDEDDNTTTPKPKWAKGWPKPVIVKAEKFLRDTEGKFTRGLTNAEALKTAETNESNEAGFKAYQKDYTENIYLRFEILEKETYVEGRGDLVGEKGRTDDTHDGAFLSLHIRLTILIRVPLEYALWATSARNEKEFIPGLFHTLMMAKATFWTGQDDSNNPTGNDPERYSPLSRIAESNAGKVKAFNYNPKPRINADGFTILRSGRILWAPTTDNIKQYETAILAAYDPKTNSLTPAHENPLLKSKMLYVDWFNNKMAYTSSFGNTVLTDLEGSIPLDDVTIDRYLQTHILSDLGESFFSMLHSGAERLQLYDPAKYREDRHYANLNLMYEYITNVVEDVTYANLAGETISDDEGPYARIHAYLAEARRIMQLMEPQLDNLNLSVSTVAWPLKFLFTLVLKYGRDVKKYKEISAKAYAENAIVTDADDYTVELPNMPGVDALLYHQAPVVASMDKGPKSAVLGVDAGGGKTILSVVDIVKLLFKKKIKRPCVVMPSGLVPQFSEEIKFYSKGKINVVPLNQPVLKRMIETFDNFNSTAFVNWVNNYPVNTIFVVSYEFLKVRTDMDTGKEATNIIYGDRIVEQWPNVEVMHRCSFDFIAVDESHKAKNLSADLTQALAAFMCNIEYVRIMSGTIIHDRATDIVGQTSLINPAIFGSASQFASAYGAEVKGGKILRMQENAGARIQSQLQHYTMFESVKRKEWAFLLPTMREQFMPVFLTKAQQAFYDKIMENLIMEIKNDPKLMKLFRESGDEDTGALEQALKRRLEKVEQFIAAPDRNEAFMATSGLQKEDFISPKVGMVDRLLAAQFAPAGTKTNIQGTVYKADPGKVIVFGYHGVSADHIYRHSRFQNQGILYHAGDEEAVKQFLENDEVRVIFADEMSLLTGRNLQVASHIIRLQTLWSPGDQEQAIARIWRPDFKTDNARTELNFTWLVTNHTVEVGKAGRLIWKFVDKIRVEENNNPYFGQLEERWKENRVDDLEAIRMSLDLLSQKSYKTIDDLMNYYTAYGLRNEWELEQFQRIRDSLKKKLEAKHGRKLTDDEVIKFSMSKVKHLPDIPGSKFNVYAPLVTGQRPNDPVGLKLEPISYLDTLSDDDEDEDGVVDKTVNKGDLVVTEFGVGRVIGQRMSRLTILVPGVGTVKLGATTVYLPTVRAEHKKTLTKKGETDVSDIEISNRLLEQHAKKFQVSSIPKGMEPNSKEDDILRTTEAPTTDEREREVLLTPKKPVSTKHPIEMEFSIFNGQIALFVPYDADSAKALKGLSFRKIQPFWWFKINTFKGGERLMEALQENFRISPERVTNLTDMMLHLKNKNGKLWQHNPDPKFYKNLRNFFLRDHKPIPVPKKGQLPDLRAYPSVWDDEAHIVFNAVTHKGLAVNRMRRVLKGVVGVSKVLERGDPHLVLFLRSKSAAAIAIKKIQQKVDITNIAEVEERLGDLIDRKKNGSFTWGG